METKKLFVVGAVLWALAIILGGCAAPLQKVTTTYEQGGEKTSVTTEGNLYHDGLERLQHHAIDGPAPDGNDYDGFYRHNHYNFGSRPLIRVPRTPYYQLSPVRREAVKAERKYEEKYRKKRHGQH